MLAREQNRGRFPPKADNFIAELKALRIAPGERGAGVRRRVHRLAFAYRLTSYDAAYFELAQRRNLPLAMPMNELTH